MSVGASEEEKKKFQDLAEQHSKIKDTLALVEKERSSLEQSLKDLETTSEQKTAELQKLLDEKESSHNAVLERSTKTEKKLTSLQAVNAKLDTQITELKDKATEWEKRAHDSEKSLKVSESKLKDMATKLSGVEKELNNFKEKVESSKKQSDKLVGNLEAAVANAEKEARANLALAQERFKDISVCNDQISRLQTTVKTLNSKADKLDSTQELLDRRSSELKRLQNQEKELRVEISSLTSIASEKEDKINDLNESLEDVQDAQTKTEARMVALRQNLQRLEAERRGLIDREANTKQYADRVQRDLDVQVAMRKSWEAERSKLVTELGHLRGAVDAQESEKASSNSMLESSRKQAEELSIRLMETTARCETLEEELSDTHKHLQERIREASTMRRLLNDTEGSQDSKLKDITEKLDFLTEERDQLESEASQLAKRRNREIENFKTRIRELEQSLELVQEEKTRFHRDISELRSSRSHADDKLVTAELEAQESREVITQLKDNLSRTESSLKTSTKTITNLKKLVEESQSRVDKLYQNQHTLNKDIRALQAEKTRLKQQLESSGATTSDTLQKEGSSTSLNSASSSTGPSSKSGPNVPYIKNILLGFLEHKDQRTQLMPVVSTVLDFKNDDEKRLWAALGK